MIFIAGSAFAKSSQKEFLKGLPLTGAGEIQILSFDKKNKMYEVISVARPGEGESWVKVNDLLKAVKVNKTKQARLLGQLKSFKKATTFKKLKVVKKYTVS